MKTSTIIGGLVALFVSAAPVFAAVTTINEYSDRYVVVIDGSMDKKIVVKDADRPAASHEHSADVTSVSAASQRTPSQEMNDAPAPVEEGVVVPQPYDRAAQIKAYMSQLPPPRSSEAIESRLEARQGRWIKLRNSSSN